MPRKIQRDRDRTKSRLIEAVGEVAAKEGFGAVGINSIARRARTDKVLIYRYFGGLEGLLAAYADEGDFWWPVDDLLAEPLPGPTDPDGIIECMSAVFARHVDFLRSHPVTLEVIAWEMAERNKLTAALETVREARSQEMMRRLATRFELAEEEFLRRAGPMFALLGAAANYLAARSRKLRVFNGIDLQSDEGWDTLCGTARELIAGAWRQGVRPRM